MDRAGDEKPGLLDSTGAIRDLSGVVPMTSRRARCCRNRSHRCGRSIPATLPRVSGTPRLGPCVGHVGKFVAIGLNYSDHAAESNMPVPAEPIVFMKATSCIFGPNDDVVMPRGSQKTDWEVELGIVIGKAAQVRVGSRTRCHTSRATASSTTSRSARTSSKAPDSG